MSSPHRPSENLAGALLTVGPLVSRWIERLLAGHDPPLTVAQFLALHAIVAESVSGSELARRTGVSGPAISQLLAGLADAGLIERREFVADRRRQTLVLSARGRRVYASAQTLLRARLAELLVDLPRPDADAMARVLPQVEALLSGAPPPRPPPPRPRAHRPPRPARRPR